MSTATRRLLACTVAVVATLAVSGCSTWSYYFQSVTGHLQILHAARPIDDWIVDPTTGAALRQRLEEVAQIRTYASAQLDLPDNASYRSYADLHRPFVVWNIVAAPALSLTPKQWCFPVVGCVSYRGYFDKAAADAYAAQLRDEGWDVQVGGVPAYSTLGWTADPVLSTFINFPEGEVARLIFHELAHQKVYAKGDSTFNESFATMVEKEGVRRWLVAQDNAALSARYNLFEARRETFLQLLIAARARLEAAYAAGPDDHARSLAKATVFADLRAAYVADKQASGNPLFGYTGYDHYFSQPLNNANLAAISTYTQRQGAFVKLLAQEHGDLPRFYAAVSALAHMPPAQRDQALTALDATP